MTLSLPYNLKTHKIKKTQLNNKSRLSIQKRSVNLNVYFVFAVVYSIAGSTRLILCSSSVLHNNFCLRCNYRRTLSKEKNQTVNLNIHINASLTLCYVLSMYVILCVEVIWCERRKYTQKKDIVIVVVVVIVLFSYFFVCKMFRWVV